MAQTQIPTISHQNLNHNMTPLPSVHVRRLSAHRFQSWSWIDGEEGTYPDFLVQPLLPFVEPVKALLVTLEQLERLRRDLGGALLLAVVVPRGWWLNCLEESNGQCNAPVPHGRNSVQFIH